MDRSPKIRIREGALNLPGLKRDNLRLSTENDKLKMADLVGELGVLSRNAQNMRLVSLAERITRRDSAESGFEGFLVGFVDVNKLKTINDYGGKKAGHDLGDDAILNVASGLVNTYRPWDDSVIRYGGDEFALFIPTNEAGSAVLTGQEEGVVSRIDRLDNAISFGLDSLDEKYNGNWPSELVEGKRPGTVSVGWGFISREEFMQKYMDYMKNDDPKKGDFIGVLVKSADEEMYAQKHNREEDDF